MLSIKPSFKEKIARLKSAKEMASFLIIENASLSTSYPDVCTAYMMYLTVPVTVATAERSFSNLKLIKNFLRSSMSQERISVARGAPPIKIPLTTKSYDYIAWRCLKRSNFRFRPKNHSQFR